MSTATLDAPATPAPAAKLDEQERAKLLVIRAVDKGGVDAVRNLNPLALGAGVVAPYDPSAVSSLAQRSVAITPVPHPLLDATLLTIGATKLGRRTYAVGLGEDADPKVAAAFLDALPAGACYPSGSLDLLTDGRRLQDVATDRSKVSDQIHELIDATPSGAAALRMTAARFTDWHRNDWERGAIVLTVSRNRLFARVCTQPGTDLYTPGLRLRAAGGRGVLDLNLLTYDAEKTRDPITLIGVDALMLLDRAGDDGWRIVDLDADANFTALRETAKTSIVATSVPSVPGKTFLHVGDDTGYTVTAATGTTEHAGTAATVVSAPVEKVAALLTSDDEHTYLDTSVADLAAMSVAEPAGRTALRPYQDLAVSRFHATSTGYLLGLAPGLGKTVITLVGWQEHADAQAAAGHHWRGLSIVPAAIRGQWAREAEVWFPNCDVTVVTSGKDLDDLDLSEVDGPALVVLSYSMAKEKMPWLLGQVWDDVCLDEAAILKNAASQRSKALWELRTHVSATGGRVLALTGTPVDKSIDDMARIVAWARGDAGLFGERKLSHQFPRLAHGEGIEAFNEVIGPCLLRRDRSEIAHELPPVETIPLLLTPTDEELNLANGARRRLKEIYDDLEARLESQASLNKDDPRYDAAKEELAKARGAVLGGVTLARMAASDPHAVAASNSTAAGLLDLDGLVAPAVKTLGTKRREVVSYTHDLVDAGEAILIFTDFSSVADHLAADLADLDVAVGTLKGGSGTNDRVVQQFQDGDIDVLIATSAGREGLNLQRAGVLVHYDLPWIPSQIVQRVGRASRIGADASRPLQVIVPVMEHTIEQRVAAVLVPRAMTAIHALDGARSSDLSTTEMAVALRGVAGTAGDEIDELGDDASIFEVARTVIG